MLAVDPPSDWISDRQFGGATEEQEAEIRGLIEQLVYDEKPATDIPVNNPNMVIFDAEGNEVGAESESKAKEEIRKRFESVQEAFQQLLEKKGLAVPILLEYLKDDRQSINFRNHFVGNSVGDACYWNIYFQLQDRPKGYSKYGYSRQGRDGEDHAKPYWDGSPFKDAGGLKAWCVENDGLNYKQMQIKCLEWLLEKEKAIGASDSDSYFLNILPLEIRILQRRLENGESVDAELRRLLRIQTGRLVNEIPRDLLPPR